MVEKMKISLLYPHWTDAYNGYASYFAKRAATYPPLNLAYLAAIAEKGGHKVMLIDAQAENKSMKRVVEETESFNPDLIGMTATTPFFDVVDALAKNLEERLPKTPKILGGHHITVLREEAFSQHYAYAFIGEADNAWEEFLGRYERGEDLLQVKGMLQRLEGKVIFTGTPKPIENMDTIPFPARHLLNSDNYYIGTMKGKKKFSTIMTIRGCPYKCIFCSTNVFGKNLRKRTPEKVVNEMEQAKNKFGAEHFVFLDDTLTLDRSHIKEICNQMIIRGLNLTFEGSTRANLVDEETISLMAKAGMIRISFGLETVNPKIREIIRKEVPLESYKTANRLTNRYGIETLNSCMIGLPRETHETIQETLDFLRNSRDIKQANISIAVPYPGTELYAMAKRGDYGLRLIDDDFSHFKRYDSAVMQVGDLSPDDLIAEQNRAFLSIYSAPWRWLPMIRKSGVVGALLTLQRTFKKGQARQRY